EHTKSYLHSFFFFFSSRRRHTRFSRDWSSDVCSSDLAVAEPQAGQCALVAATGTGAADKEGLVVAGAADVAIGPAGGEPAVPSRSEERRVGKECRRRGSQPHEPTTTSKGGTQRLKQTV